MKFGILIFPRVEELDFVGPYEMVAMWHQVAGGPDCVVIAETRAAVLGAKGLSVIPHHAFCDCPPLDYLLVPGGQGTRTEVNNEKLLSFIASQAPNCRAVLSVCTGSFVLHAAGLLTGKRATTHWRSLDRLRALGDVSVVEDRFVRDGAVWTSAGVSAGMDLLLAFIAETSGEEAAATVQAACEYYPSPRRYGDFHNAHAAAPGYIRDT